MKKTIIFFDGVCNLCDSFVNFVFKRDSKRMFFYAPLQGVTADSLLSTADKNSLKQIVLFHNNQIFKGYKAIQKIFCLLYPKISLIFKMIPGSFLYQIIAKKRYRLFGKKEGLYQPSTEQKSFFLP